MLNDIPTEEDHVPLSTLEIFNTGTTQVERHLEILNINQDPHSQSQILLQLTTLLNTHPDDLETNTATHYSSSGQTPQEALEALNLAQIWFMHYIAQNHQIPIIDIATLFGSKYACRINDIVYATYKTTPSTTERIEMTPMAVEDVSRTDLQNVFFHTA